MDGISLETWQDLNQRYVMLVLASLKEALQGLVAGASPRPPAGMAVAAQAACAEFARAMPAPPALDVLAAAFGLSPFERDLLMLCAGVELDTGVARLCAEAQGNPQRPAANFGLALAVLTEPHWSALSPAAPLRRWRLIELAAGETLTGSTLRIDERILHFLTGLDAFDDRLSGFEVCRPDGDLPPSQAALTEIAARAWQQATAQPPVIQLHGEDMATRRAIAARAASLSGMTLRMVRASALPQNATDLDNFLLLWEREVRLGAGALLLECDDEGSEAASGGRESAIVQAADRLAGALVLSSRNRRSSIGRPMIHLQLTVPTIEEQCGLWRAVLLGSALHSDRSIAAVVDQFRLGPPSIHAAASRALADLDSTEADPGTVPAALWDACRAQARPRLTDLAQPVEAIAEWGDLVLPEPQLALLHDIVIQVRHRTQVYENWGFSKKGSRGLGISALFAGPSGTGKTMAGEVLARELRLDLYRVDLSQVVSKYIGETEKNLRQVFDTAEQGSAILLFDEADALFGKRTEIKDSHDRFANIEVSYLLQRMEAYHGLAILTTNLRGALDTAFLRRLRFIGTISLPRCRAPRGNLAADLSVTDADRRFAAGHAGSPQHRRRQYPQHRSGRSLPRGRRRAAGAHGASAARGLE